MVQQEKRHNMMYAHSNTTEFEPVMTIEEFIEENGDYLASADYLRNIAVEIPGVNPLLAARFARAKVMPENATKFLPFFGTDIGFCSLIKPQISFDDRLVNRSFAHSLFGVDYEDYEDDEDDEDDGASYVSQIEAGATVGMENGLTRVLDAETFDYSFHRYSGEGFKVS